MIVRYLYIGRAIVTVGPFKTDSPLFIDPDTVFPCSVDLETIALEGPDELVRKLLKALGEFHTYKTT